jgi:selenocysteine lyase/cysteine desulfurase
MKPAIPKEEFDLDGVRWMMHCGEGPTPRRVIAGTGRLLDLELRPWTKRLEPDVLDVLAAARTQSAEAISAPCSRVALPEDITLSQSTSSALTLIARGFPFAPGDEVLAPLGEFPSNVWPWKGLADRGVSFREVPLWDGHTAGRDALESTPPPPDASPERRIADAIGLTTRLVTASWVRFQDGMKLNLGLLGRLCRERGVPLVIDGIQGAGAAVPDIENVSAFACGGHKGLLGMSGQGFLWTDAEFRMKLSPLGSWLSVEEGGNFGRPVTDFDRGWLTTGQRLEQGGYNVLGAFVLGGSLGMLNAAGIGNIENNVRMMQAAVADGLVTVATGSGPFSGPGARFEALRLRDLVAAGRTGPILCLHHHGRGPEWIADMVERLGDHGIIVSAREGYLRIALHAWHDDGDVSALLEAIA